MKSKAFLKPAIWEGVYMGTGMVCCALLGYDLHDGLGIGEVIRIGLMAAYLALGAWALRHRFELFYTQGYSDGSKIVIEISEGGSE